MSINHKAIISINYTTPAYLLLIFAEIGGPETSGQDANNDDRHLGNRIISESAGHITR
jgi:hypothetical protein